MLQHEPDSGQVSGDDLRQHAAILQYVRAARRLSRLAAECEPALRAAVHDLPRGRRGVWLDFVAAHNALKSVASQADSLIDVSPLRTVVLTALPFQHPFEALVNETLMPNPAVDPLAAAMEA